MTARTESPFVSLLSSAGGLTTRAAEVAAVEDVPIGADVPVVLEVGIAAWPPALRIWLVVVALAGAG